MVSEAFSPQLLVSLDQAAKHLSEGGVIVYPTETFYGLGAALSKPDALKRLAELKGREGSKPMPVIVAEREDALALWRPDSVPELGLELMRRFWPGPLTIVLPALGKLPFEVAPRGEVGIRVSSHPVARELARRVGPLAATSANPTGRGEASRVSKLDTDLVAAVDFVLDAGETPGGRPSTVLGFKEGLPVVLREGAIQKALIDACMP